jgi:hypothetical protein
VPEAEEAAAGRPQALEPDLEPAKGKRLIAKGESNRALKTTISSALVACVLLLALAAAPPRTLASGNANWGTGVELTAPANAAEGPEVRLSKVSCPSTGNCTVIGSYDIPPEHEEEPPRRQGELLSETGGRWEPAVEATMPANAASNPEVERFGGGALSCPAAGDCTAVGEYRDSAGHQQGFLLSETAGAWGTGVEASLPANAGPEPQVTLDRLSCPSAGNCTAAGNYVDSSGNWRGLLVSETAGTWSAASMVPSLPANAAANPEEPMRMGGVSCTSAGNCTAVGDYTESSGDTEGFLWRETAGVWGTGVETTPPANAASNPRMEFSSLSCPSAENCSAVGQYTDSSGATEGLMLSETSGTWGTGVEAIMPAGARAEPDANIGEVQCPAAGNCTAIGNYIASNSREVDSVFLTETAGVWGAGVTRPLPANAAPQGVIEGSLSCPAAGDCSYVGSFKVNEFVSRPLLVTENDGTWGPGINGTLPANVAGGGGYLSSVSCTAPGNCTAVGSYDSYNGGSANEFEGMVFTATPATAFLSASGPLGGAFAGSPISASRVSATLAGGSDPIGTITFTVFGPQSSPPSSCTSGGTTVAAASAYGDGTYNPSAGFTPPSPGDYWWYASYGGDAGDEPATSPCGSSMAETTVVPKVTPTLSASGPLGGVAGSPIASPSISAALAGGSTPTGMIAFTVFGPQSSPPRSCASGGTTVGTASVNGNGTYQPSAAFTPYFPSLPFTPPSPGEYWWYASYGGDAGDEPVASACGALMAQTLVAAAPTTGSSPGKGSSGPGSGAAPGTGAKTPAPALSGVKLGSKRSTGRRGTALKLTLSQPATIEVLIAQNVKAHKHGGVCKPTAKKGKSCTTTVEKRTLTFSGSAGSNTFKLELAGLGKGSYTATITAENANGKSSPVRLTFTIAGR